jgi:Uma2 family endonuclease
MDQAVRKRMTLDEFLAWERRQELRYEFDGFRPIAMTGGTVEHNVIGFNIAVASRDRLRGGPCRGFHADLKIIVAGRVRYPDAVITCSPVPRGTDIVPEPVVVFEVLSASTATTDREAKNAEYRATSSIRHCVILEQSAAAATLFSRSGEDWVETRVAGAGAVVSLPAIGIDLPLSEVYAEVGLDEAAAKG